MDKNTTPLTSEQWATLLGNTCGSTSIGESGSGLNDYGYIDIEKTANLFQQAMDQAKAEAFQAGIEAAAVRMDELKSGRLKHEEGCLSSGDSEGAAIASRSAGIFQKASVAIRALKNNGNT